MAAPEEVLDISEIMDDRVQNAIAMANAHGKMPNYNEMIFKLVEHVKQELMTILGQIKSNDPNINLANITSVEPGNIKKITEYIPENILDIIDIEFCNEKYEKKQATEKIYYVKFTIILPKEFTDSTKIPDYETNINNYTTLLSEIIVYLSERKNIRFNNNPNYVINLIPFVIYYSSYTNVKVGNNTEGNKIENKLLYNYGLPVNKLPLNNKNIHLSICINYFSKFIYNIFSENNTAEELDKNGARIFLKDVIERDGGLYINLSEDKKILQENWQSKIDELDLEGANFNSKIIELKARESFEYIYKIIGELLFTNITDENKKLHYSKIVTHICSQDLFNVYLRDFLCEIHKIYMPYHFILLINPHIANNKIFTIYNSKDDTLIVKRSFNITAFYSETMNQIGTNDMIIIYNFATDKLFITMDITNNDLENKLKLISKPMVFFLSSPVNIDNGISIISESRKSSRKKRSKSTGHLSRLARSSSIRRLEPQTSV